MGTSQLVINSSLVPTSLFVIVTEDESNSPEPVPLVLTQGDVAAWLLNNYEELRGNPIVSMTEWLYNDGWERQ